MISFVSHFNTNDIYLLNVNEGWRKDICLLAKWWKNMHKFLINYQNDKEYSWRKSILKGFVCFINSFKQKDSL